MKYKYTRKEIVEMWSLNKSDKEWLIPFIKDLLAQKEDKKECKHKFSSKDCRCFYCGKEITSGTSGTSGTFTRIERPTPSPLEIEEIEEMKVNKLSYASYNQWAKIMNKINSLISNQKKLYQLIKEKL